MATNAPESTTSSDAFKEACDTVAAATARDEVARWAPVRALQLELAPAADAVRAALAELQRRGPDVERRLRPLLAWDWLGMFNVAHSPTTMLENTERAIKAALELVADGPRQCQHALDRLNRLTPEHLAWAPRQHTLREALIAAKALPAEVDRLLKVVEANVPVVAAWRATHPVEGAVTTPTPPNAARNQETAVTGFDPFNMARET